MSSTWHGEKHVWEAAAEGDIPALQSFLTNGVDVNVADGNEDFTPLICAAGAGQRQAIDFLLAQGADVNKSDLCGMTPLMAAAGCGHVEVVKLLLENGADVTSRLRMPASHAGNTVVEFASRNGHSDVVAILEKAKTQ